MSSNLTDESARDAQSVSAVRGGDLERYRELVERHERRVFAVAWSRLGDATLAEEATQEAFIRGYRRLWLLGDGAKFSGWIASIGRRVAINIGLRHRRELNKRERWALEEISVPEGPAEETAVPYTPETLRQALAELQGAHRECLVLFYLEGKSGAEAAAALGISESAFRVRLHRARGVLRGQLEAKLAGSLEKLRPAKSIVPAVMAAVLVSSSAKAATAGGAAAAGIGAKVLSVFGKTFLFSWLVPLISIISFLPGMGFALWVGAVERRNFRETGSFRARLHRAFFRSFLWGFPLAVVLVVVFGYSAVALVGTKAGWCFIVCFLLTLELISARSLTIGRNPFQVGMFVYCTIIFVGLSAMALGWIPPALGQLPLLAATAVFFFVLKHRPTRMDYNLFLRATQGMLKLSETTDESLIMERQDRRTLLAFARFLGSRWLAGNFRWETRGMVLRLPPVKTSFIVNMIGVFMPPISQGCSHILLQWDGNIVAHCGTPDAAALAALDPGKPADLSDLENFLAKVVGSARREFRKGNPATAERLLGESPESEVFIVPPARAKSTRWWRIAIGLSVVLMAIGMLAGWKNSRMRMVVGRFNEPVRISEAEIHYALNQITNPPGKEWDFSREIAYAGQTREALPPTNMFSPAVWQQVREQFAESLSSPTNQLAPDDRLDRLLGTPALQGAYLNGWLTADDIGLDRRTARQAMAQANPDTRKRWFELREGNISDGKGDALNFTMLDTRALVRTTRTLQKLGCLDLADVATNVETILRQQVLSSSLPAGRRFGVDPKLLKGMFLTFGYDPIEDTYESLAILDACGALKRVDREACINGILRFHHGKGLFGSVRDEDGFVIFGDTRDTFFGFELLRMLNALDRVKDLEQWQFRPLGTSLAATPTKPRVVTWEEIEAWVFKQRLENILRNRKASPPAPLRSLLEP